MITKIDQLNYNPCEMHTIQEFTLNDAIKQIESEKTLERMYYQGIEEDDFMFLGDDDIVFLTDTVSQAN